MQLPDKFSWFKHYTGGKYQVLDITGEASTKEEYPIQVSYRGENGNKWSKSIESFTKTMTACEPGKLPKPDECEEVCVLHEGAWHVAQYHDNTFNYHYNHSLHSPTVQEIEAWISLHV